MPEPFEPFAVYCTERLKEDPHLWASALYDEVVALGFDLSNPSFTRGLRTRQLRLACEQCRPAKGRPVAITDHLAGEETQWDWLELPDPPGHWDCYRGKAFLLVGALSHSGKWRGTICQSDDQAHLIVAMHRVAVKLGGLTRDWRFDRMASVVYPSSGMVTPSFSGVAKHYGVHVGGLPAAAREPQGVVEKGRHSAAQRWWRTVLVFTIAGYATLTSDFRRLTGGAGLVVHRPDTVGLPTPAWLARASGTRVRGVWSGRTGRGAVPLCVALRSVKFRHPHDG